MSSYYSLSLVYEVMNLMRQNYPGYKRCHFALTFLTFGASWHGSSQGMELRKIASQL